MKLQDFLRWRCQIAKKVYETICDIGYKDINASVLTYLYVFTNEYPVAEITGKLFKTNFFPSYSNISKLMCIRVQCYNNIKELWGDVKLPTVWVDRYKSQGKWFE